MVITGDKDKDQVLIHGFISNVYQICIKCVLIPSEITKMIRMFYSTETLHLIRFHENAWSHFTIPLGRNLLS